MFNNANSFSVHPLNDDWGADFICSDNNIDYWLYYENSHYGILYTYEDYEDGSYGTADFSRYINLRDEQEDKLDCPTDVLFSKLLKWKALEFKNNTYTFNKYYLISFRLSLRTKENMDSSQMKELYNEYIDLIH